MELISPILTKRTHAPLARANGTEATRARTVERDSDAHKPRSFLEPLVDVSAMPDRQDKDYERAIPHFVHDAVVANSHASASIFAATR
jgi:hypothetical protein